MISIVLVVEFAFIKSTISVIAVVEFTFIKFPIGILRVSLESFLMFWDFFAFIVCISVLSSTPTVDLFLAGSRRIGENSCEVQHNVLWFETFEHMKFLKGQKLPSSGSWPTSSRKYLISSSSSISKPFSSICLRLIPSNDFCLWSSFSSCFFSTFFSWWAFRCSFRRLEFDVDIIYLLFIFFFINYVSKGNFFTSFQPIFCVFVASLLRIFVPIRGIILHRWVNLLQPWSTIVGNKILINRKSDQGKTDDDEHLKSYSGS